MLGHVDELAGRVLAVISSRPVMMSSRFTHRCARARSRSSCRADMIVEGDRTGSGSRMKAAPSCMIAA